jgi:hypothetical protein
MRLEGKVSKVAICNGCNKMILASHIDCTDKSTEKEFTQFTNEGFIVKIETIAETKDRDFGSYSNCSTGNC